MLGGGATLVLLVNAIALGGVYYNRHGDAQAVLRLAERELGLPYYWQYGSDRENSGIALRLVWRVANPPAEDAEVKAPNDYERSPAWLDEQALRELGFALPPPRTGDDAGYRRDRLLPRSAWLVLEMDGAAHRQVLQETERWVAHVRDALAEGAAPASGVPRLEDAEVILREERETRSRLFVIAAGSDPEALRLTYPDRSRHAIVRGRIRAHRSYHLPNQPPSHRGYIESLDIEHIHVPRQFHAPLGVLSFPTASSKASRYEVTLSYGHRAEPWISALVPRP